MQDLSLKNISIGFIGAGNMAVSLIKGLLSTGINPTNLWAADIDQEKLERLAADSKVNTTRSEDFAATIDVLVLAVKPQAMKNVCLQLTNEINGSKPLIISIAAGITTDNLAAWLGADSSIVRCMPNTPALIGKGASALFANSAVSDSQKQIAQEVMEAVGISVWVPAEADIDSVTAVSGSGPAYFFLFIEAIQNAAVDLGLSEELARQLSYHTALGAAELAIGSDDDIETLRKNVTSPGGTTEKAILAFENGGLRELVADAVQAAQRRSIELGKN
ncbi:MAG: pyrroline-5-carboxylate reductase [Gammaproteobacteria bacterium]|nr:pyrroline-5-carboxylate reductase [Gammaproteobacteria bacterium]